MKLYLIHGWTYDLSPWQVTVELLTKSGIEVQLLRVPGLTDPSKKVWKIKDYVEWADTELPDGVVALGHSNGGRILLNLAVKQPDKLRHLILLNSAGIYESSRKRDVLQYLAKTFGFLKKNRLLRRIFHKLTGASDYEHAPPNMKKTLTNMLESDQKLDLTKIQTPTTILWGENDQITPVRHAKIIKAKISQSTLKIHPGWGHAPYIKDPEGLAQEIKTILEQLK